MATKKNLWGELPSSQTRRNPYSILKEQANVLGEITNGLLVGEVKHLPPPIIEAPPPALLAGRIPARKILTGEDKEPDFYAGLKIVVPALNNYKYSVLQIKYPIQFYPLRLVDLANEEHLYSCSDEEAFERALEEVLSSEKVRGVIDALLNQVRGE